MFVTYKNYCRTPIFKYIVRLKACPSVLLAVHVNLLNNFKNILMKYDTDYFGTRTRLRSHEFGDDRSIISRRPSYKCPSGSKHLIT